MVLAWVLVNRSDGGGLQEKVYADTGYDAATGEIGKSFRIDTGMHTFELIDALKRPTWRKDQIITQTPTNSEDLPAIVTLQPIAPNPVKGGGP